MNKLGAAAGTKSDNWRAGQWQIFMPSHNRISRQRERPIKASSPMSFKFIRAVDVFLLSKRPAFKLCVLFPVVTKTRYRTISIPPEVKVAPPVNALPTNPVLLIPCREVKSRRYSSFTKTWIFNAFPADSLSYRCQW